MELSVTEWMMLMIYLCSHGQELLLVPLMYVSKICFPGIWISYVKFVFCCLFHLLIARQDSGSSHHYVFWLTVFDLLFYSFDTFLE